jgi:preprotein translocase subunit SecA
MRQVERYIFLRTLDAAWRDHLYEVDQLRDGIGWQSVAGKDPLIEYKKEAFKLFDELLTRIHRETARNLFKVSLVEEPPAPERQAAPRAVAYRHEAASAFSGAGAAAGAAGAQGGAGGQAAGGPPRAGKPQPIRRGQQPGRNDPCPCGSGKKYKKCCMLRAG